MVAEKDNHHIHEVNPGAGKCSGNGECGRTAFQKEALERPGKALMAKKPGVGLGEGMAKAEALQWEGPWPVQKTARRPAWL